MALYAFDGTWNQAKENDTDGKNTNVSRFFEAYRQHSGTNDYYRAGVGTRLGALGKVVGGVFGAGELPRLNEAYDHLCQAWADGDRIIDIVGFSRGAATTLDFCHIIQERKIRTPGTHTVVEDNPQIRFLGVWDIVAAFGLANLGATDLNIGHHISLPKASLQFAFHAMALDERRPSFLPTRLHGAYEVWFRGVHSDVGGGNTNRGLNDITMKWMMSKAMAAGLPITAGDISTLRPDPSAQPHVDKRLPLRVRVVGMLDRRHYTVSNVADGDNPPDSCPVETVADEQTAADVASVGVVVLTPSERVHVAQLSRVAELTAQKLDFPLDGVRDALGTLIEGRIPLVTNDDELGRARDATSTLVATMIRGAKKESFAALNEFFLTQALFQLRPLFPFTD